MFVKKKKQQQPSELYDASKDVKFDMNTEQEESTISMVDASSFLSEFDKDIKRAKQLDANASVAKYYVSEKQEEETKDKTKDKTPMKIGKSLCGCFGG